MKDAAACLRVCETRTSVVESGSMRGKYRRYTFVMEILGGTYVGQGTGASPELALCGWLRGAAEDEFEWAERKEELLDNISGRSASPVEGCENVWCVCGSLRDHLFLIHIVGMEGGAGRDAFVAEEAHEHTGSEARRWGWGDRR